MKDFCIVSDFDGTISKKDGLYTFISRYAKGDWQKIEQDWTLGKISSKECLVKEFELIPNLTEDLVLNFVSSLEIDDYFVKFYEYVTQNNIDFYIVSDGIDYFIAKILYKYGLEDMKIISNHGEFVNKTFKISFPNDSPKCINNAGTCKCNVLETLRRKYKKIYYIGDGVSDFCVSNKPDILFAKSKLAAYCKQQNTDYEEFEAFDDILKYFSGLN